jgi:hypothetical protein
MLKFVPERAWEGGEVSHQAVERFRRALEGAPMEPVVEGFSFVDPSLLPGVGAPAREPALALVHAAGELHLDFAFVPSWEGWAAAAVRELRAAGVAAVWAVPGVLTPALEHLGVAEGLREIAREPSAGVRAAMETASRSAAEALDAGLAAGADAIVVADDLAGSSGPIVSPDFLEAEVFPLLAGLARSADDAGLPALMHCDGAAESLYGQVHAAGFAALHGDLAGRTAAALAAARRAGIALAGGIAAADLGGGLARAVAAGTAGAAVASGGGLLICDDGGVATAAECAALFAALGAARG